MRTKLLAFIFFIFLQNVAAQEKDNFDFNKIYSFVLQGDVAKVLEVLDTLPDSSLNSEEELLKQKFFARFKDKKEVTDFITDDPVLQEVIKIYQNYWRKALLDKKHTARYEKDLRNKITKFLKKHNSFPANVPDPEEEEYNFAVHLKNFFLDRGYFSATGKTAGLYDLFVWSTEKPLEYHVTLPETEVVTTIIFLEDVITMGWEEYGSFGKVYPGGWATKDVLYAVAKAYDTTSEDFEVSYLKHESQHFADYEQYPLLTGADLEYRAKLNELIYADKTLFSLISNFIRNASSQGRNSHAFASYALMRDLSKNIFNEDFVTEINRWKAIPPERIKEESHELLLEHSEALRNLGADTVKEFIK